MKPNDIIDSCMITIGGIYSIANLQEVLGIIILIVQIIWLCTKIIIKIHNKIVGKANEEIPNEDIHKLVDVTEHLLEELTHKGGEDNGQD